MSTKAALVSRLATTKRNAALSTRKIPLWIFAAFVLAIAAAYIGAALAVYGIHGDYDSFVGRSVDSPFWFVEEWQLLSVARPVAVYLSNVPLYPMRGIADFPWGRVFSIATLCANGLLMIRICVRSLNIRPFDALGLAIVAFLPPGFGFWVMNLASWAPYLVSIWFAFCGYSLLSMSNKKLILFHSYAVAREYRGFSRYVLRYARQWHFCAACLFFQLAMYDYPANALFLCLFPVIGLLFSQYPFFYRALIACRDVVFIGGNLVVYFLTTKLIYFPILKQHFPVRVFPESGFTSEYRFELQNNLWHLLARLLDELRVAGDLWFLPQSHAYAAVAIIIAAVFWLAQSRSRPCSPGCGGRLVRLKFRPLASEGTFVVAVTVICYFVASAPVLLSIGGFVDYRTMAVPTALSAVLLLFALGGIAETLEVRFLSLNRPTWRLSRIAVAAALISAIGVTAYHIHTTVRLALNEFGYVSGLIRHAVESGAKTLVVLDWRPITLPNDLPVAYDQRRRAVMPYQMGCFSSYCFSQPAIYSFARQRLGYGSDRIVITIFRAEEAQGLTCSLFAASPPEVPRGLSAETVAKIKESRDRGPVSCVPFDLVWHDIGISLKP